MGSIKGIVIYEQYFVKGYLDTILIVLGFVGICLIIFGTFALYKIMKNAIV